VVNENGDLTIVGDSPDANVHVTATPFVMAAPGDPSAAAMLADVAKTVSVSATVVGCSYATRAYGDIPRGSSGCVDFVVHIPPGTPAAPTSVRLSAHTMNGPLTIESVNLADHDCMAPGENGEMPITCPQQYLPPNALADVGDIIISGVTGSMIAQATKGNVAASITPNAPRPESTPLGDGILASYIEVTSMNANAALSLPSDFAADALNLTSYGGAVTVTGFSDVTPNSLSRGASGTGARVIDLTAQGTATLSAL
jgi:hypothetical protein